MSQFTPHDTKNCRLISRHLCFWPEVEESIKRPTRGPFSSIDARIDYGRSHAFPVTGMSAGYAMTGSRWMPAKAVRRLRHEAKHEPLQRQDEPQDSRS